MSGATSSSQQPRSSFRSLVGSELFKIRSQTVYRRLALAPVLCLVVYAALCALSHGPTRGRVLQGALDVLDPLAFVLQFGLGAPLAVISARSIAQEYHLGTVQVLVGRGVGRVRLLLAELAAMGILAGAGLAGGVAVGGVLAMLLVPGLAASVHSLPAVFWKDAALDLLATVDSLTACVLLGAFIAALSRSLSLSVAMSVAWMPFENLLVGLLGVTAALTNAEGLRAISAFLLAPNLNFLPQALEPWREVPIFLPTPQADVDATQAVVVTLCYLAIFLGGSILLTWRRDVAG